MPSTALAMKASRARLGLAMLGVLCVAVGAGCARRAPTGVAPAESAPNASTELRPAPADHAHSEAARFFEVNPTAVMAPTIALAVLTLAVAILGAHARRRLDPIQRGLAR